MKIAVSGKGGVGKTTIAAALVKLFSGVNRRVYAIDADPDVCLAAALGIPDDITSELKPLVEMKELIYAMTGGEGSYFTLNPEIGDVLDDFCICQDNIRYLRMGGVKKGGSSCYCRENAFLNAIVSALLLDKNDVVVMDMGAGIEHLSRGTARGVDLMLVVVEPGLNSVNTAGLVKKLAADLGIKKVRIIGNKIRNRREKDFVLKHFPENELLGFVNYDEGVWESSMESGSTITSKESFLRNLEYIQQKILNEI
jgi:CO dehydrogenase maturation factor